MRTLLTLVFLSTSAFGADEPAWTELLADNSLNAFKGKTDGWAFAESVQMKKDDPRKLSFTPGKGILVNGEKGRAHDLTTKDSFKDIELSVEFLIPKGSNSGIKFHAVYEIQIFDSFGKKKVDGSDCGGIYPRAEGSPVYHHIDEGIPPKVNACKEPGEWQKLEAIFTSPRFDAAGKKTANARLVKATLNGQLIHENQELLTPTGTNYKLPEKPEGPLLLQGDHGPVAFRKLKVRPYKAP